MNDIDRWFTRAARGIARRSSRRSFLARLATLILGGSALPLLPVARVRPDAGAETGEPDPSTPSGDPKNCQYWRHCAIDGFLCGCCGGSQRRLISPPRAAVTLH